MANVLPVKHFSSTYHTTPTRIHALSAAAVRIPTQIHHQYLIFSKLLCTCRWVAMGRKHNSGNAIPFSGGEYSLVFKAYHLAVTQYFNHPDIGPNFRAHLDWLNTQGL